MKDLFIASYKQPLYGSSIRCGAIESVRDTNKQPVAWSRYRLFDRDFRRSRYLLTVRTLRGFRLFYAERVNWSVRIPLLGTVFAWFCRT